MVVLERYDRQERISGWKQEKLANARVAVLGSDKLSDFLLIDLLSLGFGNITRIGQSDFLDFYKINPEVYLEQRDEQLASLSMAKSVLQEFDVIIDTSQDQRTFSLSKEIAKLTNKHYFSALSNQTSFAMSDLSSNLDSIFNSYKNKRQGLASSIIASGILADELRKRLMPLENDLMLTGVRQDLPTERNLEAKVLQIGAGAIGTFAALSLASLGADLTIIDFDVIEETNLNRQFLFYNANGQNKATILKERLQRHAIKEIKVKEDKIGADFNPSGFNYVFCCVDNNLARYHMNNACSKYGVPLINGGSSINAGQASSYVPGKTMCLDCQTGFNLTKATDPVKRPSGACFQPSLIIPNQIVAGMMLSTLYALQTGSYKKFNFSSGNGIFDQDLEKECYDSCITRKGR